MNDKEYDILVVGELNIDLILNRLNKAPAFGKEQKAEEMTLTMGSSSAIFAANCASLGAKVAFCGKVGTDSFGEFVMETLSDKGIHSDAVIVDENLKTGATIIFRYGDDRMMVTHPGAMDHMSVDDVPSELFEKSRHLHTSAIFFQPKIKKDLFKLFSKAKERGMTTSLDSQWDPEEKWDIDLEELLPVLDFFLPNEQELLHLTGTATVDEALQKLSKHDTTVVVKRSEKGAVIQHQGERTSIPGFKVTEFVDAVGAGDSFNAGFIHAFLNGRSMQECLESGNLTAAVSTTAAGGTSAIKSYNQIIEQGKKLQLNEASTEI